MGCSSTEELSVGIFPHALFSGEYHGAVVLHIEAVDVVGAFLYESQAGCIDVSEFVVRCVALNADPHP